MKLLQCNSILPFSVIAFIFFNRELKQNSFSLYVFKHNTSRLFSMEQIHLYTLLTAVPSLFERSLTPAVTAFKIHIDVPITLKCTNVKFPTILSLKTKISIKIYIQITPLKIENRLDKYTRKGSKTSED